MSGKVTDFGKFLRKLRIDRSTTLRRMAEILGISPGYLSAIELGKREVPFDLVEKVHEAYSLSVDELEEANALADMQITKVNIDLDDANRKQKEVFLAFAREFESLDAEALDNLFDILQSRGTAH